MKITKVAILLADGFEELEALTPLDIFRREGISADLIGIDSLTVTGAHNITVTADKLAKDTCPDEYGLVIFPGGMPGAVNLDKSVYSDKFINSVLKRGGRLAAICAAPLVLGRRGLLKGISATCFPGFESELVGARIMTDSVVTDKNITTANGMPAAMDFAWELVRILKEN